MTRPLARRLSSHTSDQRETVSGPSWAILAPEATRFSIFRRTASASRSWPVLNPEGWYRQAPVSSLYFSQSDCFLRYTHPIGGSPFSIGRRGVSRPSSSPREQRDRPLV